MFVRICAGGNGLIADLRNTFRVSFIMSDAPMPIASASELLPDVQTPPAWDGPSISPANADYPRVHFDWHEGHGFVFQCYEHEESSSDFLVTSRHFSLPSIEMELGGQALERWPRELFVSAERATQALNHFLEFGKEDPALEWVRIDSFPRETLWEGRAQREAWSVRIRANDDRHATMVLRSTDGCSSRSPRGIRPTPGV